jgi:hypothetical protein
MNNKRGFAIGALVSQMIGNIVLDRVDRVIKHKMHSRCYVRYCDDMVGMTRSKAQAWREVKACIAAADRLGLTVKADFVVSKIADRNVKATTKKKKRKRQRCKRASRNCDKLLGLSVLPAANTSSQVNETIMGKEGKPRQKSRATAPRQSELLGLVSEGQLPQSLEQTNRY